MDSNKLLEDSVTGLARQCRSHREEILKLEDRVEYLEKVLLTLIVALKSGGIITDPESGSETYEF